MPSSKILFSTLLPRNDIPTPIITSINDQVIKSCSKLPNVQLIKHDNLFANQLNILRDNKHILKRHIGLFAKKMKDAIHGRLRQRQHQFVSPHYPNTPLRHTSYSSAVKNTPSPSFRGPQAHPPPLPLVTPRLQQQIAPAPSQAAPYQNPNAPSQTLPHPTNIIHQQIPPATHQTAHISITTRCIKRFRTLRIRNLSVKLLAPRAASRIQQYPTKSYPFYDF